MEEEEEGWRRRSGMPGAEGADVLADWIEVLVGWGRVGRSVRD